MKSKIHKYLNLKLSVMSKKLILTSATVLFIGLIAFAYESSKHTKTENKERAQKKSLKNVTENNKQDESDASRIKWFKYASARFTDLPQELKYEIHARYSRPIKKEQLNEVALISDIIPGYPAKWIDSYVSVEISAVCDGKFVKAVSSNEVLSAEQKNIINTVGMGADIVIEVNYTYKVPVTNTVENNIMHVSLTLVPQVEAEYIGGKEQMINFLKANGINKFAEITHKQFQKVKMRFTVNEEGSIVDAKIFNGSGNPSTDYLLLDAINKMPKWKAAEDSKGIKVKQEFEFIIGNVGC